MWPPFAFILGSLAWLSATFGPIALAIISWRVAQRVRWGWTAHLVFLPLAVALVWYANQLVFFAAGDTGDGPPGLGLVIAPSFVVLLGTVVAYYCALVVKLGWLSRRSAR